MSVPPFKVVFQLSQNLFTAFLSPSLNEFLGVACLPHIIHGNILTAIVLSALTDELCNVSQSDRGLSLLRGFVSLALVPAETADSLVFGMGVITLTRLKDWEFGIDEEGLLRHGYLLE
jgi:hypothetical protein